MPVDDVERVRFLLHLKRDRIDDYLTAHEHVWPEMLDALRRAGWHNYSLFDRGDGLVADYFDTRLDHAMDRLTHYFHLP